MGSRVLIVASSEESREAAFLISEELRSNGYSVDFSNAAEESNIKSDKVLDKESSLSGYKGVVFLDDGGDPVAAMKLAKRAMESEIVIGGLGPGCAILGKAGALKGQYAPADVAKAYDGKPVDAPSSRSGDIVTSLGSCPIGFATLFVEALGGKVKNIIVADEMKTAALVISKEPWPTYWQLASEVRLRGYSLVVAGWEDIDVANKSLTGTMICAGDVKAVSGPVPKLFWLQQADVSPDQVASLEAIGCIGTSTSESIRKTKDAKEISSLLASEFPQSVLMPSSYINIANAMSKSYDILSSSGTRVARIIGKGDYAIVSANGKNMIGYAHEVAKALTMGPLAKSTEPVATMSGKDLEFGCCMAKTTNGWVVVAEAAFVGEVPHSMQQASLLTFMRDDAIDEIRMAAIKACEIVESDVVGIKDMAVFISAGNYGPCVRVESPAPYASFTKIASLSQMAIMMGMEAPDVEDRPVANNAMADLIVQKSENRDMHMFLLEREMAREGMWPQPDGMLAIDVMGSTRRLPPEDAFEMLKKLAIRMYDREARCHEGCTPDEQRRTHIGAVRAKHRLMLLTSYVVAKRNVVRTAGIYGTSIAGPYANLDLPWNERVMEWKEGDDWLTDRDKAIQNQPRYNPEYERTTGTDEFGFYYRWDDEQRTPYYWSRRLTDGTYPTRSILQNNPKGN